MTRWIVASLIVLNLLLGAGVYLRWGGERAANAQIGAARGNISAVSGFNANQSIVYMLEANTGRLVAIRTDPTNHKVEVAAYRTIADDLRRFR